MDVTTGERFPDLASALNSGSAPANLVEVFGPEKAIKRTLSAGSDGVTLGVEST